MALVSSTDALPKAVSETNHFSKKNGTEGSTNNSKEDVISVAKKFETLMLHTMLKSMRATIVEDELTGSNGEDLYRDMMDQEIAKNISESGGFGIQAVLARQLSSDMGVNVKRSQNTKNALSVDTTKTINKQRVTQLQQYQNVSGMNNLINSKPLSLLD